MLASQMIATHDSAMRCLKLANLPEQSTVGVDMYMKHAEKMMQLYARQLEALSKYRNKGKQKITVERVNVEAGGQAIVGNVSTSDRPKNVDSEFGAVEDKSDDEVIMPAMKPNRKRAKAPRGSDE